MRALPVPDFIIFFEEAFSRRRLSGMRLLVVVCNVFRLGKMDQARYSQNFPGVDGLSFFS
jgi:hypothetical protein